MKKYYYAVGKKKFGPFSFDELLEKNLDSDTLIWFDGLPDWAPLSSFPEFDVKTNNQPPPLKFKEKENSKSSTKIIVSIIFGLLVIGIGIGIYAYPKIQADKKFDDALEVFKNTDSISYGVFKELAEQNYPKAHFILGLYYERLEDSISAKSMFEKALAVDKDIPAYYWLAYRSEAKVGKDTLTNFNGPFYKNLENWVNTIEPSDWLGQLSAAWIYNGPRSGEFQILANEKGEELSYEEFGPIQEKMHRKYLELAANNGSVEAMEYLGYTMEWTSNQPDFDQAIFWYKKAAELGNSSAMARLGDLFTLKERHFNVDMYEKLVNNEEAKKWISLAVKSNNDMGYYLMGNAFQFGHFGDVNLDSAKFYYNKNINYKGNVTSFSAYNKRNALYWLKEIEDSENNSYQQNVEGSGSNSTSDSFNDHVNCDYCGRGFYQRQGYVRGVGMDCAEFYEDALTTIRIGYEAGYDESSLNYLLNSYTQGDWYCSKKCIYESGNCISDNF